jgi:DNA polymerase-1
MGKAVNFAVVYGEAPSTLASELGISVSKAEQFISTFFEEFPRVTTWETSIDANVRRDGYVASLYGRRRRLPNSWSTRRSESYRALRQAINAVNQSTAADIHKLALVRLSRELPAGWRMLLPVHDSLLLEVPSEEHRKAIGLLRETLEVPPPHFTVPLSVQVHHGASWGECQRT